MLKVRLLAEGPSAPNPSGLPMPHRAGHTHAAVVDTKRGKDMDATELRTLFERKLSELDGITVDRWKEDYPLIGVNFHGKEVGHFHGQNVLDLRLSPKVIKEEALTRTVSEECHPKRSPNSRWICIRFENSAEVDRLVHLVKRAIELR